MKLSFATLLTLLIISFNIEQAIAQENNIIKPPSTDSFVPGIILVLSIVILLALVLRLIKNNERLNETVNTAEKDGKQWLDSNLKDLDAHQLEMLIKRSNSLKGNAAAH